MRRIFKSLTAVPLLLAVVVLGHLSGFAGDEDLEFVPNEIVIKLSSPMHLRLVAKRYNLSPDPIDRFGKRPIYRMRILDNMAPPDKAAQLLGDNRRRVLFAEPNYVLYAPESRRLRESWSIGEPGGGGPGNWYRENVGLPSAHTINRGQGITIAVLDTGVDQQHPALAGRLVSGFDFVDFDNDPSEEGQHMINPGFGHGTHVAGLIAAAAPDAKIVPVRVLDENGVGNIWVLAEALEWVAALDPDGDPTTDDKVGVINLSLSTYRETELLEEVLDAITCSGDDDDENADCLALDRQGIVVVAAAGNSGTLIREYPAAESDGNSGLIAVGAHDPKNVLAAFSTYGGWVDITAPGVSLISTVPPNQYGVWSGTSMAAPLVAAQAAMIRSHYLDKVMTAEDVVERIVDTSDSAPGVIGRRINIPASLTGIP